MERWKEEDGGWKRERGLMGGRFIRTEADKERKERRKNCVGGGGESLIWRGKREATATNDGLCAPPSFDKFFRSFFSWMMEGLPTACCLDCARPMIRRYAPKSFYSAFYSSNSSLLLFVYSYYVVGSP
jgi:hypothetical protein